MNQEDYSREYDAASVETITPRGFTFTLRTSPRLAKFFTARTFEAATTSQFARLAKQTDVVIDIGAHHGFYSILAGTVGAKKIYAFEPIPENVALIKANVAGNALTQVEIVAMAASDKKGTAQINRTAGSDTSSFVPHPLVPSLGPLSVATVRVDDVVKVKPGDRVLVKIDTEGYELAVFEGLRELCTRVRDVSMLVEFNPKCQRAGGNDPRRQLEVMRELGFDLYLLDDFTNRHYRLEPERFDTWPTFLDEKRESKNILCVRPERSLSVVFFSQLSSLTGSERSLLELVRELVTNHGTLVTVVFPKPGTLVDAVEAVGATTLIAPYHTWHAAFNATKKDIEHWMRMSMPGVSGALAEISRINPHLIATNTRFIPWGLVASQVLKKPHVLFPREAKILAELGVFLPGLKQTNELFYQNSEVIICNSVEPKEQFGNRPKCFVGNAHIFIGDEERDQKVPPGFIRKNSYKLLLPGNLYRDKGGMDAVHALAELVQRGYDVELLLLGVPYEPFTSELRAEVRRLKLDDRVHVEKYQENPYPFFKQADCVVVCSYGESFGRVMAEAMVLGVPVVATDILGARTALLPGKTGLSFTPGDFKMLAQQVERLIKDPSLAKTLALTAQTHMREHFTEEAYGGEIWKLFMRLKAVQPTANRGVAELTQKWAIDALAESERERSEFKQQSHDYRRLFEALRGHNKGVEYLLGEAQSTVTKLTAEKRDLAQQLVATSKTLQAVTSTKTWQTRSKLVQLPGLRPIVKRLVRK